MDKASYRDADASINYVFVGSMFLLVKTSLLYNIVEIAHHAISFSGCLINKVALEEGGDCRWRSLATFAPETSTSLSLCITVFCVKKAELFLL